MNKLFALVFTFIISLSANAQDTTQLEHKICDFAIAIEDSMYQMNGNYMRDQIDLSRFVDTAISQFEARLTEEPAFPLTMLKATLMTGLMKDFSLGTTISNTITAGGDYRFIHYFVKNGEYHIVFRLSSIESAYAYHIMPLDTEDEDDLKIYNIFTSMTGEYVTETMADAMVANTIEQQASADMRRDIARLREVPSLAVIDPKAAMHELDEINGPIRSTKVFTSIQADVERIAYPERVRERQLEIIESGEPISLHQAHMGLAYWSELGDVEKSELLIDTIRATVGNDPYLHFFESIAYHYQGDYATAIQRAQQSLEANVDPFPIHFLLSVIYIEKGEPKMACEEFGKILLNYDLWPIDLVDIYADYPDFVKSDAYKNWEQKFLRTNYPDYFKK